MDQYEAWISAHVPDNPDLQDGRCTYYAPRLKEAFPELVLCRGWVHSEAAGDCQQGQPKRYPHMWCQTVDGRIVDPTVGQFLHLGTLVYILVPDGASVKRCPYCGEHFIEGHTGFCSEDCLKLFSGR